MQKLQKQMKMPNVCKSCLSYSTSAGIKRQINHLLHDQSFKKY